MGMDTVPSQDDYGAHQENFKRVSQVLGIQIKESSHVLMDILLHWALQEWLCL